MLIVANAEVIFDLQRYFDIQAEMPNIDYYTTQAKQAAMKYVNQGKEFISK